MKEKTRYFFTRVFLHGVGKKILPFPAWPRLRSRFRRPTKIHYDTNYMDHLSKRYGANNFCKSVKQSRVSYSMLKMEKAVQKILWMCEFLATKKEGPQKMFIFSAGWLHCFQKLSRIKLHNFRIFQCIVYHDIGEPK